MGKEVREISRFFVAPPHLLTHKYLHLSTYLGVGVGNSK